jgi:hypothetical protein
MRIQDINTDTDVEVYAARIGETKVISVHGVRPTGADGPWLGELRLVDPPHENAQAKLWAFYPVLETDRYQVSTLPAGSRYGKQTAAWALRDFIAARNLSTPFS